jgi:hypothetical protein
MLRRDNSFIKRAVVWSVISVFTTLGIFYHPIKGLSLLGMIVAVIGIFALRKLEYLELKAGAQPSGIRGGPLRSRVVGTLLVIASPIAAAVLFLLLSIHLDKLDFGVVLLGGLFAYVGGKAAVDAGRRMRQLDGWDELRRDPRPPVIFLRPFFEDVRKHYGFPVGRKIGGQSENYRSESTAPEPKIAPALRSIGPFIAVGAPGEWLAPIGAARLYLDDDQWKSAVEFLVAHAMAIVLQPDATPGTSWELEAAVKQADPRRILLLVPNLDVRPLGFKRVRWLCGRFLPVPLPDAAYDAVTFDERWSPHPLQFGKKPQLALRPFIERVRQLNFDQEKKQAFAAFVNARAQKGGLRREVATGAKHVPRQGDDTVNITPKNRNRSTAAAALTSAAGPFVIAGEWFCFVGKDLTIVRRLDHLVWVYVEKVRRSLFFIPIRMSHFLMVWGRDGVGTAIPGWRYDIEQDLHVLRAAAPWLVIGYSEVLKETWNADHADLIRYVDAARQRAAAAQDGPSVPEVDWGGSESEDLIKWDWVNLGPRRNSSERSPRQIYKS